jgi:cytochrome b6-f complex iron-sulfur subunit
MNRREFLGWVGVGGLASHLPTPIADCSQKINQPSVSATPSRADGFTEVGTVTELEQKGELSQDQVLVVHASSESETIVAVNPTCTHAGCTVIWEKDQKAFVCPCHESEFAPDGKVLQGPAEKPLATYPTKLEGDTILVKTN